MNKILIPTQLFIGPQDLLLEETEIFLQKEFCKNPGQDDLANCFCNECRKIKNQQHESIIFINPEKTYSTKDIEIIFERTSFAIDENKKFFFVLQRANTLNMATANRLLKILEEPPMGYNFILHTNNLNAILPTIISRCHIKNFNENSESQLIDAEFITFTNFFFNYDLENPTEFTKELKRLNLTDNQSIEIMHYLIDFYAKKVSSFYKPSDDTKLNNSDLHYFNKIYNYLISAIETPPLSGSSNLFWKNLYICFPKK